MSKTKIVFLDLDRTLFDTRRVIEIWRELARHYELDADKATAERSNWYVWISKGTYYHDFSAQLRAYNIDPVEAFEHIKKSKLARGEFEFPYTDVLVGIVKSLAEMRVLSFGADDYQRLKAALCPSLEGVEVITTLGPKQIILERYASANDCWLVDDKPIGHDMPAGVNFVQVALESEVPDFTEPWPIFTSLKDVKEYLYEQLH